MSIIKPALMCFISVQPYHLVYSSKKHSNSQMVCFAWLGHAWTYLLVFYKCVQFCLMALCCIAFYIHYVLSLCMGKVYKMWLRRKSLVVFAGLHVLNSGCGHWVWLFPVALHDSTVLCMLICCFCCHFGI